MAGYLSVVVDSGVARVTISNDGKLNAMSQAMWGELRTVFLQFQTQQNLRCVVIQGAAEHFCAGGDIAEYPAFRFEAALLRDFHENTVWGGLHAMLACDVPVVAAIDGNCMGAGLEIASCCDVRIASVTARFGAPIARLGFPMAPREAALVMRSLGELTAREMLLAAAVLDANTLAQRGFISQVVSEDMLATAVGTWVDRIGKLAPRAARLNKQTFRALAPVESIDIASKTIANAYDYADSPEHREGIHAFLEKRSARF